VNEELLPLLVSNACTGNTFEGGIMTAGLSARLLLLEGEEARGIIEGKEERGVGLFVGGVMTMGGTLITGGGEGWRSSIKDRLNLNGMTSSSSSSSKPKSRAGRTGGGEVRLVGEVN
jgi:hypothetical protein